MRDHLLEGREREPEEENKLEGEVEGEPVDDADQALNDAIAVWLDIKRTKSTSSAKPKWNAYVKREKTTQYCECGG